MGGGALFITAGPLGRRSGFDPPDLDRPGRLLHQQGYARRGWVPRRVTPIGGPGVVYYCRTYVKAVRVKRGDVCRNPAYRLRLRIRSLSKYLPHTSGWLLLIITAVLCKTGA